VTRWPHGGVRSPRVETVGPRRGASRDLPVNEGVSVQLVVAEQRARDSRGAPRSVLSSAMRSAPTPRGQSPKMAIDFDELAARATHDVVDAIAKRNPRSVTGTVACSASHVPAIQINAHTCFALLCGVVSSETMPPAIVPNRDRVRPRGRQWLATAAGVTTRSPRAGTSGRRPRRPTLPRLRRLCLRVVRSPRWATRSCRYRDREQRDLEASKTLPRGSVGADPNEYDRKGCAVDHRDWIGTGSDDAGVAVGGDRRKTPRPTDVDEPAGVNVLRRRGTRLVARCRVHRRLRRRHRCAAASCAAVV